MSNRCVEEALNNDYPGEIRTLACRASASNFTMRFELCLRSDR